MQLKSALHLFSTLMLVATISCDICALFMNWSCLKTPTTEPVLKLRIDADKEEQCYGNLFGDRGNPIAGKFFISAACLTLIELLTELFFGFLQNRCCATRHRRTEMVFILLFSIVAFCLRIAALVIHSVWWEAEGEKIGRGAIGGLCSVFLHVAAVVFSISGFMQGQIRMAALERVIGILLMVLAFGCDILALVRPWGCSPLGVYTCEIFLFDKGLSTAVILFTSSGFLTALSISFIFAYPRFAMCGPRVVATFTGVFSLSSNVCRFLGYHLVRSKQPKLDLIGDGAVYPLLALIMHSIGFFFGEFSFYTHPEEQPLVSERIVGPLEGGTGDIHWSEQHAEEEFANGAEEEFDSKRDI